MACIKPSTVTIEMTHLAAAAGVVCAVSCSLDIAIIVAGAVLLWAKMSNSKSATEEPKPVINKVTEPRISQATTCATFRDSAKTLSGFRDSTNTLSGFHMRDSTASIAFFRNSANLEEMRPSGTLSSISEHKPRNSRSQLMPREEINNLSVSMKTAVKSGQWSEALEIFKTIPEGSVPFSCYALAINAHAGNKDWKSALDIVPLMDKAGVKANEAIYTHVIGALGTAGQWEKAVNILGEMGERGLDANVIHYNAVISAIGQGGIWAAALNFLESMVTEGKVAPDVVTYNTVLTACNQASEMPTEQALTLFTNMKARGVTPDLLSYCTVNAVCCKSQRWSDALATVKEMQRAGFRADTTAYNTVLTVCASVGKYEECLDLFSDMLERKVKCSIITYNCVIMSCLRARQVESATKVLGLMCERGCKPDRKMQQSIRRLTGTGPRWQQINDILAAHC